MGRGQGERLPIPTDAEYAKAINEGCEIVACSALKKDTLAALAMGLRSDHTATVCVDLLGAVILVATLKELFPGCDSPPGSPLKVTNTENRIESQAGRMSG